MNKQKEDYEKVNFWLTKEFKKIYKHYCVENHLSMSKHIRELIEADMNKNNKK